MEGLKNLCEKINRLDVKNFTIACIDELKEHKPYFNDYVVDKKNRFYNSKYTELTEVYCRHCETMKIESMPEKYYLHVEMFINLLEVYFEEYNIQDDFRDCILSAAILHDLVETENISNEEYYKTHHLSVSFNCEEHAKMLGSNIAEQNDLFGMIRILIETHHGLKTSTQSIIPSNAIETVCTIFHMFDMISSAI